jgi:hypothetical protein
MNQLSYNSTEGSYPYKICPTKAPFTLLHEVYSDGAVNTIPKGRIHLPQRRLENIIAMKVNYVNTPNKIVGGVSDYVGFIKVLKSPTLGSLLRTNQFLKSSAVNPLLPIQTTAEPVSDIIGYAVQTYANDAYSSIISPYDNNRILFFSRPYDIQYFDWSIEDLVKGPIQNDAAAEPKRLGFIIEFYYACDCVKKY